MADLADYPDDNLSPNNKRLIVAVDNNSIKEVKKVVGRSGRMANVNVVDGNGWPVLHRVSTESSTRHLRTRPLHNHRRTINPPATTSPQAANQLFPDMVRLLLKLGADADSRRKYNGTTAIINARK